MSKIADRKFHLAWELPTDKDVVNSVLFFGSAPVSGYDGPAVRVPAPKADFIYPDDAPQGFLAPSNGSQTFVAVAAEDGAGNLSDLVSITVPFDVTPPGPVSNLRLV